MADNQDTQKSKLPLYCGIASILSVILLFLFTEFIFDSSIMLKKIFFPFLLVAFLPFAFMKLSDAKKANMLAIGFTVITFIVCGFLFYMRNKVNKIWIENPDDPELANKLIGYLKPSGVIIIASSKADFSVPGIHDEKSGVKDAVFDGQNGPTKEGLSKRLNKNQKTDDGKNNNNPKDTQNQPLEIKDEDYKKLRFSGLQNQLVIYAKNIQDQAAAAGLGFKTLSK